MYNEIALDNGVNINELLWNKYCTSLFIGCFPVIKCFFFLFTVYNIYVFKYAFASCFLGSNNNCAVQQLNNSCMCLIITISLLKKKLPINNVANKCIYCTYAVKFPVHKVHFHLCLFYIHALIIFCIYAPINLPVTEWRVEYVSWVAQACLDLQIWTQNLQLLIVIVSFAIHDMLPHCILGEKSVKASFLFTR